MVPFPDGSRGEVGALTLNHTGIAAAAKTDGRAGDGVVTVTELDSATPIRLRNHEVFQLTEASLDPVAGVGDLIIVCNNAKIHSRNLVLAAYGDAIMARRYNISEAHPEVVILTGESVDPYALPEPLIIAPEAVDLRKIVGTVFAAHHLPVPPRVSGRGVVPLDNASIVGRLLDGAQLFEVRGRSAEPIALEGQFLITRSAISNIEHIARLSGRLVIAVDEDGTRYFKRMNRCGRFAVLESLNPDGTTPAELLSFEGEDGVQRLVQVLEVVGVLFEMPRE